MNDDFYIVAFDQEAGLFCPKCSTCITTVSSATINELQEYARHHSCEDAQYRIST